MTDDLRTRIAKVYRAHRLTFYVIRGRSEPKCDCGWRSAEEYATYTDHPEHVADAVIAELGLRLEGTDPYQVIAHGYKPLYRYVTEWETDERL